MKILIVDDEIETAGLLGELLRLEEGKNRNQDSGVRIQGPGGRIQGARARNQEPGFRIQEVFLRTNLEEALKVLPECDAVISDGNFLQHPGSRFTFDLWTSLFAAALKQGKRFVLYSGDGRCVQQAAALGITAFLKPASGAELYRAVREGLEEDSGSRIQDSAG